MALSSTKPTVPIDNVESVDMEMSSEEEPESSAPEATKTSTSVSFSLSTSIKPLPESPLIEKEEPKTSTLPRLDDETPSPKSKLFEPPPLPSVEIFADNLDEESEAEEQDQAIPTLVKDNMSPRFVCPPRPRLPMNRPRFPQWRGNMRGQHLLPPPPPPPPPPMPPNMRGRPFGGPRFRPPFENQGFRGRPPFRGQRWPQRFNSWSRRTCYKKYDPTY